MSELQTLAKDPLPYGLGALLIDHIGIAVHNLEESSSSYRALGLTAEGEDETIISQQVKVRAFRISESLLELLEPTSSQSPIASFLEKKGAGLHHIALRVADISAEVSPIKRFGARFINPEPRPGRSGSQVVFLHPKWGNGVLIELVEHH
ncbi:MAG: methylmalonyl-CoA epimerase [Deinococcales bacterium]